MQKKKHEKVAKDKQMAKIATELGKFRKEVPKLKMLTCTLNDNINKIEKRKTEAEDKLGKHMADLNTKATEMIDKAKKIEKGLTALVGKGDAEAKAVSDALAKAEKRLEGFSREDTARLLAAGPVGLDLSQDYAAEDPCPEATKLLAEAVGLFNAADAKWGEFSKTGAFDIPAADIEKSLEPVRAKLKALDTANREACCDDAYAEVAKLFHQAVELDTEIEAIAAAKSDIDKMESTAEEFKKCVESIDTGLKEVKKAELAASQAPVVALEEKLTTASLPAHTEMQHKGAAFLRDVLAAKAGIESSGGDEDKSKALLQQLISIEQAIRNIGLTEDSKFGQPDIKDLPEESSDDEGDLEEEPLKEGELGWSVKQSHKLGGDISKCAHKAPLLGKEVGNSLSLLVKALNNGMIECNEGYCLLWSESKQSYYLAYRKDRKKKAYAKFRIED